ncbi:MAG TPA: histidine kinase dimerization/phospho-acceptor domain-containing protein [Actinomycetota bacterium]|nr:histidine kinase dimerization/phospho-acceptor domain-containing protein [Actinomycetota bacterium]
MDDSRRPGDPQERIERLERELERLRASEKEARAARDESERRGELLHETLRRLNHDLRNGLGGILGFAALLRDEEDLSEQQREDVTDIYNAGQKMLELLNEMLETTKRREGNGPAAS